MQELDGGDRSGGRLGSDRYFHAESPADADQSWKPYQRPCVLQSAQYRAEQRSAMGLRFVHVFNLPPGPIWAMICST